MDPLTFDALRDAVETPRSGSRETLFAGLAASRAAWRVRAAEGLLKLFSKDRTPDQTPDRALASPFGRSVDAILTPSMDELRKRIDIPPSEAWTAFLASTPMDYDAWHDGRGFDVDALLRMPSIEQDLIRQWLHTKLRDRQRQIELREIEAAAVLGETELLATLARHPDADVRLRAKELRRKPDEVARELSRTLAGSRSEDDVLHALDLVPAHATPAVRAALIKRVSKVDATFINSAMVLLEVFGGVADAWNERPLLFRIQSEGARGPLLKHLIDRIGRPAS